jgi:hypothetical protein
MANREDRDGVAGPATLTDLAGTRLPMPPQKPDDDGRKRPTQDEALSSIRETIDKLGVARKALLDGARQPTDVGTLPARSGRRRRSHPPR